jgi:hypothetical protein
MPAPDRIGNVQTFSNVINPTKGIVGYYSDAEVDALLAALPAGGGLQTVDLSAYATTAYVDGQIATLYSKAEVDAAITAAIAGVVTGGTVDLNGYATEQFVTDAIAAIPPANLDDYYTKPATDAAIKAAAEQSALDLDAVQSQLVFAIEETGKQTQEKIDLKADKATTYTKAEVDEALANVATGGTVDLDGYAKAEDLPAVYEQDGQPTGKDGDLWLSTPVAKAAEISALVTKADTTDLDAHVTALVRKLMNGGKEPPADIDWKPTVLVNVGLGATGLIEARLRNGQITLRGELSYTTSATGSYTDVRVLTTDFPRPDVSYQGFVIGKENGVTFRPVSYTIKPDGRISICPIGGKITHVTFDGATAFV